MQFVLPVQELEAGRIALGYANLADVSSIATISWYSLEMPFGHLKLFGSWPWINMRTKLFSPPSLTLLCVIDKPKLNISDNLHKKLKFNPETYTVRCSSCTIRICTAINYHIPHSLGDYPGPGMVHCNYED